MQALSDERVNTLVEQVAAAVIGRDAFTTVRSFVRRNFFDGTPLHDVTIVLRDEGVVRQFSSPEVMRQANAAVSAAGDERRVYVHYSTVEDEARADEEDEDDED